jgi:hypothetical protein
MSIRRMRSATSDHVFDLPATPLGTPLQSGDHHHGMSSGPGGGARTTLRPAIGQRHDEMPGEGWIMQPMVDHREIRGLLAVHVEWGQISRPRRSTDRQTRRMSLASATKPSSS